MKRACIDCEIEQKILDRTDPSKTHGVCRRHFEQFIRNTGCTDAEVAEAIAEVSASGFCPDLSEVCENNADALQKQHTLQHCK